MMTAITAKEYFAGYADDPGITQAHRNSAALLLTRVNDLLEWAVDQGWKPTKGTHTGTMVSGQRDGGWRPQSCPIGAPHSAHKDGRAVDVADHDGALDALLDDDVLAEFNLYREAPSATDTWCHLTDRAPGSGHRTFNP